MSWKTVTKSKPCPICRKPDWCGISETGVVRCMRIPSDRESNGGWLHGIEERVERPVRPERKRAPVYEPASFNSLLWWQTTRHTVRIHRLTIWALQLGLPMQAIDHLGATTLGDQLNFPMYDGKGIVCGIRTRLPDGSKKAVFGSRAGVFLSTIQIPELEVLICEGPTDSAAALALDFEPIGRPSCQGQEQHVVDTLKGWGKAQCTLCADSDGPGIDGATKLAKALRASRIAVRLVAPAGHKDLREWFRAGATRNEVDNAWSQARWI